MSAYASFESRQAGIRVAVCEPNSAIRAQLRAVIDSDPLLILAGESHSWADCEACLEEMVPELLIARSDLIPSDWRSRIDRDSFLPVVISLRPTTTFPNGGRRYNDLRVPAEPPIIKTSLDRAVRDVYERKAKQLLYLVDRYVAGSQWLSPYKTFLQVERDGNRIDLYTDSIVSIVAARKHVSIHSTNGHFMLREPIHQIASRLDPGFFVRIHRSIIINLRQIDRSMLLTAQSSEVFLSDGSRYRVGPNYREALADALRLRQQN